MTFAETDSNNLSNKRSIKVDTIYKIDKIEIIYKSFDNLVADLSKKENEWWNHLISFLSGVVLTSLFNFLIERWKTSKEKEAKKRQLVSRGFAKKYLLTQLLNDLAMYKVHKRYYLRASKLEENSDKEDSFKKHYEKGQEQRVAEAKLDDDIAEYFEIVLEYAILSKNVLFFSA